MRRPGRIFVQIAAYRDPDLLPTLIDCVAKAARPERLTFGIMWQRDDGDDLGPFANDPRCRIDACHWRESRGACWARHRLQRLYDGEEYTLALDSHHRFLEGWDVELEAQFAVLDDPMAMLTSYLPALPLDESLPADPAPVILAADRFTADGVLLFDPFALDDGSVPDRPLPARFYSAHFAFSRGAFVEDCPHDPELYFWGEEITLSVRAFTHGYHLHHPHRPVAFHRYGREGRPLHWEDQWAEVGPEPGAWRLDVRSKRRVRALLGMEPDDTVTWGRFGLGRRRSLADYEEFAGVRFADRWIGDDASRGESPTLLHR